MSDDEVMKIMNPLTAAICYLYNTSGTSTVIVNRYSNWTKKLGETPSIAAQKRSGPTESTHHGAIPQRQPRQKITTTTCINFTKENSIGCRDALCRMWDTRLSIILHLPQNRTSDDEHIKTCLGILYDTAQMFARFHSHF